MQKLSGLISSRSPQDRKKFRNNVGTLLVLIALTVLALPSFVSAQSFSGVTGIVSDSNGAAIPGVDVKLINTKTNSELTTKTNDQGVYRFTNVPPGSDYKLTFAVANFQTLSLTSVALGVGTTETHNATLTAGNVSAVVEVTSSNEVTLNTTDASIGNVIDTRQLRELPIQIRSSPAALIGLQPGVVGNNVGTGNANRVGSVTGSRADQGNITVDGIDANDQATGQFAATVGNAPIDAIQEFRATSTNPDTSEGRSAGGQIELFTKPGTNSFHGSLREYNRSETFAANSFFANRAGSYTAQDQINSSGILQAGQKKQPRPHLVRNQFGGNLGGPIMKDKLFFFFDYEGRIDRQGVPSTRIVPLDHFRNGGLGFINNTAGCTFQSRLNTTPNCITILTPAQVAAKDPQGIGPNAALLAYLNGRYPHANDPSLGDGINTGGFRFNATSKRKDATYTTRFDWNATDKQKVFVRFNIARRTQDDTVNSVAEQFPGDGTTSQIVVKDYSIAGGWDWTITNSFFNRVTIGNSHSGLDFPNSLHPLSPNTWTFMNTTNGAQISGPYASISTQSRTVDTPTIRDDATYTWGGHTFTFGGSIKPIRSVSGLVNDFNFVTLGLNGSRSGFNNSINPATILGGPTTPSGTAKAAYDRAFAFLIGRFASVSSQFNYDSNQTPFALAHGKTRDYRYNEYEFYGQDNWKLRSDLTLNLGLRWQYYEPPYEAKGFQASHNIDFDELVAKRLANGPAGVGGDSAEPFLTYDLAGKMNTAAPFYKPDKNNFSPRAGFAYVPTFGGGFGRKLFGDRKTVIRGGYSLQYERVGGALTFIEDQVSYLFDSSVTTNFSQPATVNDLLLTPRFTGINNLPVNNTPIVLTRPFTPFVDNGVPFGNAEGDVNYTISNKFEVPYYHQYSIGFQRELPGNFIVDVSYVGRLGRKLFTQADAAQIIDFKDPASGQTLLQAFNAVQAQIVAGTAVTDQPFFENQGALAIGAPCAAAFGGSCTAVAAANVGGLFRIGDASDTVQFLNAIGALRNNVGLSGQFSTNAFITNLGHSRYDGLLVSVRKRFSQGLKFDFNYTFSHSKDNNSSIANTVFGGLICDIRDLNVCYGPSDFDIHHLLNVNGIWELPVGRGKWLGSEMPSWANAIVGGIQLSGIFTYRSGLPFSTTTGSFPVGFVFDSPAVLTGNASALASHIDTTQANVQFFGDPAAALAAFRNPHGGEIGQRNNLRGPNFWNLDLGLAKNFKLPWEGQRLQLRADAFNLFNVNMFGLPNANFNSTGTPFGAITTSSNAPREMQFAIRWDF
jgi:hypothetical protein